MKYSTSVVLFIVFCAYCSSQLSGCARAFELASAITDPKSKTATFEPNDPPGDYYLFSANDGVHGNEMWRSDGSPQGTRLLKDLISIGHGNPRNFIAYDGAVYLIADQNDSNAQVLVYRNRKLEVLFDMATNNIPVTNNLSMFRVAQRLLLLHRNSNTMQFYSINLQGSDFRQVEGFSDTIQYLGQRGQKNENTAIFIDYTVNGTQNLWSTDGISAHLIVSPDPNIQLYWSAQIGEDIYYLLRNISQQDLWFWHSNKDGSEQELLQSFIGESRDIPGSYPMDLGDQFLFSIRNDVSAMLWRIDASGMSMIKKLNDNANSYINYRILFGDSIYFIVENNDAFELWKSNGTAAASVYLTTIANSEGLGSLEMQASRDGIYISYSDSALENKDQILFFRSDGTNATLSPTAFAHMSKIATLDDSEYFFAQTFDNEVALYKKTDTLEKVKVFFENHPSRNSLWRYYPFVLNNRLYAKAYTLEYADEIWQSDGTANGTTLLKEIVPGKQRSFGEAFIVQDNVALFSVLDPNVGLELWMSDGSANGTRLLQDFNQTLNANGSDPGEVILLDNKKLFLSNHMFNGSNLMVSDGSRLGTQVLVDTRVARYRNPLIKFNNKAIFLAYTDDNQEELHISDGTTFRLLKDLDASYGGLTFKAIAQNQTQLFFTENNRSLWVTDGSTLGTQQLLSDITGINRVYDLHAHVAGENLILFIDDNDTPVLVEDGGLTPISINIPPDYYDYLALDGKLFFSETRQSPGSSTRFESSIVQTDGSQDGTTIVKTVENKYISFVSYRSFDGITFYIEETDDEEANYQWQLFQFDGVNHQAITGLPISSRIKEYVRNDNNAYVTLFADNNDPARDSQIWKISSNFQASLLVEIISTQQAAQPQQLELINNKLFFNAFTDSFGREPWVSDGSPDGTHMLLDVRPGSESSIELD